MGSPCRSQDRASCGACNPDTRRCACACLHFDGYNLISPVGKLQPKPRPQSGTTRQPAAIETHLHSARPRSPLPLPPRCFGLAPRPPPFREFFWLFSEAPLRCSGAGTALFATVFSLSAAMLASKKTGERIERWGAQKVKSRPACVLLRLHQNFREFHPQRLREKCGVICHGVQP